jgi:hypothetical protein
VQCLTIRKGALAAFEVADTADAETRAFGEDSLSQVCRKAVPPEEIAEGDGIEFLRRLAIHRLARDVPGGS